MKEKFDYLKLDLWGAVSVDLKMAKITAEGSFSYLTDRRDHRQVDFASLHYMSQTKTETVNGDLASEGSVTADCGTFKRLPEDSRPSHMEETLTLSSPRISMLTTIDWISKDILRPKL